MRKKRRMVDGRLKLQAGDRVKISPSGRKMIEQYKNMPIGHPTGVVKEIKWDISEKKFYAVVRLLGEDFWMPVSGLIYQSSSNPKVEVSDVAIEARKRMKGDKKAGHSRAADYWEGVAAGAFLTGNPKTVFCDRCRRTVEAIAISDTRVMCPKCGYIIIDDNPRRVSPTTRRFNGKTYHYVNTIPYKVTAVAHVKKMRKKGLYVRWYPETYGGYSIWVRADRRNPLLPMTGVQCPCCHTEHVSSMASHGMIYHTCEKCGWTWDERPDQDYDASRIPGYGQYDY